jgi:hypothetical protein
MKWITREYVKVDRVACPWLIKKFVDKDAEFIFVPTDKVMDVLSVSAALTIFPRRTSAVSFVSLYFFSMASNEHSLAVVAEFDIFDIVGNCIEASETTMR